MLPPLYARWIDELLHKPIPEETKATCLDCAMCHSVTPSQDVVFNPNTKCCTYHPDLPNFLAGSILADTNAAAQAGRNRLLSRLTGTAVLRPQGVFPSLEEGARYTLWNPDFGQFEGMLCPYFLEDGLCSIWQHRNARCSTWFCKHVRGATGRDFWRALKELLAAVEQHVSTWCVHLLDAGSPSFRELFPPPGVPNLELFQRQQDFFYRTALPSDHISTSEAAELRVQMWGRWLGKEQAFYLESSAAVSQMDWEQVAAIGGESLVQHSLRLVQAFAALLNEDIGQSLKAGAYRMIPLNETMVRVWAYSNYDPVDLPESAIRALVYFDGRSTGEVITRARDAGISLTSALVRTMCDYGILQRM